MATTSDSSLLRRKLGASDYSASAYVRELASATVGGHELNAHRRQIEQLSEETASQLKRHVYEHYGQLIWTAGEIAHLESEMYHLSNMINEQRTLIVGAMDEVQHAVDGEQVEEVAKEQESKKEEEEVAAPLVSESADNEFEQGRILMQQLLQKVEHCSHVSDVPSRFLLHHSDLVEMDDEHAALHRVHAFLFNDGFMVAVWIANRRGPVRYAFNCLFELDSLAVVNVRDLGDVKHAFKLLVFPDAKLFQCANSQAKQEWMAAFEDAKRRRQKELETMALKRSDTITQRERNRLLRASKRIMKQKAQRSENTNPFAESSDVKKDRNPFNDSANPFDEDAYLEDDTKNVLEEVEEETEDEEEEDEIPEWLAELSDDLEVYIAQREFEQAVDLIFKAQSFCASHSASPWVREADNKVQTKLKSVIEVLKAEVLQCKSKSSNSRATRRAVKLLIKLKRSTLAVDLFLAQRTTIIDQVMRSVKLDANSVNYVQRLSSVFFTGLLEAHSDFEKCFDESLNKNQATFLCWVHKQVREVFCERLIKTIFSPSVPLDTIASAVNIAREWPCRLQSSHGIDLVHVFDNLLCRHIERTICEHRDKQIEAVKLRASDDRWEPINCFNTQGTQRFLSEMANNGFVTVKNFVFDDCYVGLTRNVTSFSLSYAAFVRSLLKFYTSGLRALINESIVNVFHSHLRHIEQAIRSEKLNRVDPKFVQKNSAFLLDTLLSLIEHEYHEATGSDCPKLGKLHGSYSWLKEGLKPVQAKYSDPNFL